jgi:hypothetical protein
MHITIEPLAEGCLVRLSVQIGRDIYGATEDGPSVGPAAQLCAGKVSEDILISQAA